MLFDNRTSTAPKIETKRRNIKELNLELKISKTLPAIKTDQTITRTITNTKSYGMSVCLSVLCFNNRGHGLDDMELRWVKQCRGNNIARRSLEMHLIFHHGTFSPPGLSVDFIF